MQLCLKRNHLNTAQEHGSLSPAESYLCQELRGRIPEGSEAGAGRPQSGFREALHAAGQKCPSTGRAEM